MSVFHPTERDFQIIHALQVDPRVSWQALAPVIGADPLTLSRRWQRLQEAGVAWSSALPGPRRSPATALVEVDCRPGQARQVAERMVEIPEVASIEFTAGAADLLLTVFLTSEAQLVETVLEALGGIDGVRSIRSHLLSATIRLGSDWRMSALSTAQVAALPPVRSPRAGAAKHIDQPLADRLRALLHEDARMPYRELGERVGISAQRAADATALLRASGDLVLRTDVSERYSLFPSVTWLFLQVPARVIPEAVRSLRELESIQLAAVGAGPANLILATCAASRMDLVQVEAEVCRLLPEASVQNRITMLRLYKHLGRVLPG